VGARSRGERQRGWIWGTIWAASIAASAGVLAPLAAAQTPPMPRIAAIYPAAAAVGDVVLVYGEGLETIDVVHVGGLPVTLDSRNATIGAFRVPVLPIGTYEIAIGNGSAANTCCLVVRAPLPRDSANLSDCTVPGYNVQCNELGMISMPLEQEIRGEPVTLVANTTLRTNYAHLEARWMMFSIRNITMSGQSPVTVEVKRFGTTADEVLVTRVDRHGASQVQLWVDVLDVPVGVPLALELNVGATERGAYRLESLVMPFDRHYQALPGAAGTNATLFSFTLLGVNADTPSTVTQDDDVDGTSMAGWAGAGAIVAVTLGVAAAAWYGRRRA
jgi:nitrogen fixation protein